MTDPSKISAAIEGVHAVATAPQVHMTTWRRTYSTYHALPGQTPDDEGYTLHARFRSEHEGPGQDYLASVTLLLAKRLTDGTFTARPLLSHEWDGRVHFQIDRVHNQRFQRSSFEQFTLSAQRKVRGLAAL